MKKKDNKYSEDYGKDNLITIEIAGQECLFENFKRNVVLVSKTKKCCLDITK